MELNLGRRRGIASVIGTIFFVLVLMAALGAQAYMFSIQAQSSQGAQQAQQLLNQRGAEELVYGSPSSGLTVANGGTVSSNVVAVVLKFANGTVYNLPQTTVLPSGTSVQVPSIVPAGNCGTATCLSKYNSIVSGGAPGGMVGLVTSLGNTFWYNPSATATGDFLSTSRTSTLSIGSSKISSGLNLTLAANTDYLFYVNARFACTTCGGSVDDWFVHALPAGATLVIFCISSEYASATGTGCTTSTGTAVYGGGSVYVMTLFGEVDMGGTAGILRLDICAGLGSNVCYAGITDKMYAGSQLVAFPTS